MLGGYGAAKGVEKIKDHLNPNRMYLKDRSIPGRMINEMNAAAVGVLPAMLAGAIRS